jgi:transcription antitermination factor NusG
MMNGASIMQDRSSQLSCYAVKVRLRQESAVGRSLKHKGLNVLMPSYIDRRRYSDRVKQVSCALFPGYLFVWMDTEAFREVVSTDGVSYLVRSGSSFQPLLPEEITTLEALCKEDAGCKPSPNFSVGRRVSIESGPLKGLCGILVQVGKNDRIVISINTAFRSVSVDVRDTVIRALD